ncbi:autotransporter outer membrane beta-barrel domain-containing protein, partial [Escherichia coli]|nr:autotransporter outer membrane beta-barrel domain-containing protein [Escherichia coli]EIH1045788.1 autotransporter outer membrane beta-barrel domain-containing protein [Escherichia coli]EKA5681256.1 autotransporter outer membrane beta-barrel domain-containing protein [Escherichia coli]ELF7469040.1 autotransporter outer membrane beta-barrel domain-containing protein [Escherichia coli]
TLEDSGFYGNSAEPSDYSGNGEANDVALYFSDSAASNYSMKNNVYFSNSTLLGDVVFASTFNANFYPQGHDSNADGVLDTNGGWADDSLNVDELNITLDNGSKWVGSATTSANVDDESTASTDWYDVTGNSLYPGVVTEANAWGRTIDDQVFQSGVFNVTLNNGSEWNTVNASNIDTLAVNNGSQVNVSESGLISDSIALTNGSSLNIGDEGYVGTDHLTVDSYSTVALSSDDNSSIYNGYYTPSLLANTITVTNGGLLDINVDQFDDNPFQTDTLELTSGNIADHNGNVVSGVFDIHSSDYVLNADLVNDRTWDTSKSNSDAWGFGLKAGYDFKLGDAGYVTPYGSVSGLFQSGDDYQLSNDMKVDGQSYDSMRYELGVDAGYTFTYSEDQALTPYFKLAYVYDDSNNDNDVNGDSIDNGTEGSAVRVGLGTQFSFTKNFSAYTDANYLGGGDVDQDWSANVGVKYTW